MALWTGMRWITITAGVGGSEKWIIIPPSGMDGKRLTREKKNEEHLRAKVHTDYDISRSDMEPRAAL